MSFAKFLRTLFFIEPPVVTAIVDSHKWLLIQIPNGKSLEKALLKIFPNVKIFFKQA